MPVFLCLFFLFLRYFVLLVKALYTRYRPNASPKVGQHKVLSYTVVCKETLVIFGLAAFYYRYFWSLSSFGLLILFLPPSSVDPLEYFSVLAISVCVTHWVTHWAHWTQIVYHFCLKKTKSLSLTNIYTRLTLLGHK